MRVLENFAIWLVMGSAHSTCQCDRALLHSRGEVLTLPFHVQNGKRLGLVVTHVDKERQVVMEVVHVSMLGDVLNFI